MQSGFTVATNEHLIIANRYAKQLKDLLRDDLMGMRYVRNLTDFPDGQTFNIASVGDAETSDFAEGQVIKYNKMDTGNFTFEWDQYIYSANSISEQFKQDSFWASDVQAMFVPKQHRAIMERVETRILSRGNAAQTASDLNLINGAPHRFIGSGTNESMALKDFAMAIDSLTNARVPLNNLVAIVDPSVAYSIMTSTNAVNLLSPMPQWGRMMNEGLVTGAHFKFNIYGVDVYVSNYLPKNIAETIDHTAIGGSSKSVTVGVANMVFSAAPGDTMPIIGGFKQYPTVYNEFNKDTQEWEFMTITRYGFKLYRPENFVTILTDRNVVV